MKLKGIFLSAFAAIAIFTSTGASANSISIGWNPHGHISYTISFNHPHVAAPQRRHRAHRRHQQYQQVNHQWRPAKRHHRGERRVKHRRCNQRHHNQRGHHYH